MSKSSLVTGGAGFIGSHVAGELMLRGHHVVVLDDLSGGFESNVPRGAVFVHGSITDTALVNDLFDTYGFDHVYHLAAYAAEGLSHFIKHFNYTNNVLGSINLINAAINHEVDCFVFTSSIAVYGEGQLPMHEGMTPAPEDSYGIAKRAVEMELEASRKLFGLEYVIFRPHNVYGEYQNIGDKYRNVVGIFMNQLLQHQPMTVFGDGEQTRAFTYIADVAPVIARSPEVPDARNKIFNIGADKPVSVNALAAAVAAAMGVEPRVRHLEPRQEVVHAFSDHRRLREVFGDRPDTPLSEGLRRMAAWVNDVGARTSHEFDRIEIWKNMPPSWRPVAESQPVTSA